MKLLIVGSAETSSLEMVYLNYLKQSIEDIELFNIADHINYSSLINKLRNRLHDQSLFTKANRVLLEYVQLYKPSIVWIFKGVEVSRMTLKRLRELGVRIVNYNADHPFIRSATAHGGKEVERSVPLYDLHFCYSMQLIDRIQNAYGIPSVYLPFGYELKQSDFDIISDQEELIKVCFVGNPDKNRANYIATLANHGLEIDVYGNGWKRFIESRPGIRVYPAVAGIDYWRVLRKYRIQLNIFRPHNVSAHNMRTFEIPCVGGIQLAPDSAEHRMFFKSAEEIFLYNSLEEMIELAEWLINLETEQTDIFRTAARRKCLASNYSYEDRSVIVHKYLTQLECDLLPVRVSGTGTNTINGYRARSMH